MLEQKILKVSQINLLAKKILETSFNQVLVEGEISNVVRPSSGHLYFSLKDESAQIRAAMFRQNNIALKFEPQNGMNVIVTAQVSLYEARGDYQLIVGRMELAGAGILHTKFLQLKTKLAAAGLFAPQHKKPLPKIPETIGVITSATGAAIRDILSVLKRRFPSIKVIIYPVLVQGTEAAPQIVTALKKANSRHECDVLILARGGGSIEDLWPFNEEIVAHAIFASAIPIISAVGHETDFTIADFVADVRAPTPSAAAELAVPNKLEWHKTLEHLSRRLISLIQHKLHHCTLLFTNLKIRLRHPRYHLAEKSQRLDDYEHRLVLAIQHKLTYCKQHLAKISGALDAISPLATLMRGYAIISKDGAIVSKTTNVNIGDQVQAKIADGELKCLVQKITKTG
jgi:exodeoxyribonuclease VII large subunit